jgi:hypothetical protein
MDLDSRFQLFKLVFKKSNWIIAAILIEVCAWSQLHVGHPVMLLLLLLLILACVSIDASPEVLPFNPVADPRAVVVAGQARFTVLSECVVRLEWVCDKPFEFFDFS